MDERTYTFRPFRDSDYEQIGRINSVILPEFPETGADVRRWTQIIEREPDRLARKLIVEEVESGQVVAWGGLSHTLFNFHPDRYFLRVVVHPAHRGRGVGHEVYERLEREARQRGVERLWSHAREDEPFSLRFLERHGFVPVRKTWDSRLTVADWDPLAVPDRTPALAKAGIRVTTFAAEGADRPEVRRRVYELGRLSSKDTPRLGDYQMVSFEEFVEVNLEGPHILPDAIFLACKGEEYVGWSTLQTFESLPDTLDIGFTGTLPEYRGRGIASELKRRAIAYARDHGYSYVITGNDSLNPRIWAINEKLGFQRRTTIVHGEKKFPRPPS